MTPSASPHALARRVLNDSIRTLYEDTLVPVREIARIAGVTERNVYALVRRLGCRPRVRLAPGGGRRIVPFTAATDGPLDAKSVQRALTRCNRAVRKANRLAAAARAARDERAAMRQARRAAGTKARTLVLLARTLRDLAAVVTGARKAQRIRAAQARPKQPRGYQWKPTGAG